MATDNYNPYITIQSGSNAFVGVTTTTSTGTGYYHPNYITSPGFITTWETPEEDEVEACHLCKSDLISKNTKSWRVKTKDQKDKETGEKYPVYVWKETTVKEFECGTIVREGDVDTRKVSLGERCIEV
jgi:hypothetical protein